MYRSRKEKRTYQKYLATASKECAFCNPPSQNIIEETPNFRVLRNIFPYTFFDFCRVRDHLLIVPKLHTESIGNVPDEAKIEFTKLIDAYESNGYNIYGRTPGSAIKTVPHQHTHCIKTDNQKVWLLLFLRKPYLRWMR
jgi:diadenosine tetraphosphate (Ap4A) HIT family hydrolase